jgi:hypothetical protein
VCKISVLKHQNKSCQDFEEHISKNLPSPAELETLPNPASIVIVGCGSSSLIPFYAEKTSCPFTMYAEPTRRLYSILGMSKSMSFWEQIPEWIRSKTKWQGFKRSFPQFLRRLPHGDAHNPGAGDQIGGDFLFDSGKMIWCHRMRNVADHSDISKIRGLLGLPAS